MRVNLAITWDLAPAKGRFEFPNARFVAGYINIGWGEFSSEDLRFSFKSVTEPCRMFFAIDTADQEPPGEEAAIKVTDAAKPFCVPVADVLRGADGTIRLDEPGVAISAEVDAWANL